LAAKIDIHFNQPNNFIFMVILPPLKNVKMKIDINSVVTFIYEMIIVAEDGTRSQQVEKSKPLTVLLGHGNLLEPFEQRLLGLETDDSFDFTLESKNTYGQYKSRAVHEFDKEVIIDGVDLREEDIQPGVYLPMETDNGTPFNGQVLEISATKIVLDFNHPLAGKDLNFKGIIKKVRPATQEELKTGKYIRPQNKTTGGR